MNLKTVAYIQDVPLIKRMSLRVSLKTRCVTKRDALVLATLRYLCISIERCIKNSLIKYSILFLLRNIANLHIVGCASSSVGTSTFKIHTYLIVNVAAILGGR